MQWFVFMRNKRQTPRDSFYRAEKSSISYAWQAQHMWWLAYDKNLNVCSKLIITNFFVNTKIHCETMNNVLTLNVGKHFPLCMLNSRLALFNRRWSLGPVSRCQAYRPAFTVLLVINLYSVMCVTSLSFLGLPESASIAVKLPHVLRGDQ